MMQLLDNYGYKITTQLVLIALGYLLWASAPLWWSAWRALGRPHRLEHPWRFAFTAACLSYGSFVATAASVAALITLSNILHAHPHSWLVVAICPGTWLAAKAASQPVPLLAIMHMVLTWRITGALAPIWAALHACPPRKSDMSA
jgi:hypothetical protein